VSASSSPPSPGELDASVAFLGLAAAFVGILWLFSIAGDPTEGFAFFTFVYTAPVLVGIALVIAASQQRDLFGSLGLAGAIVVLATSLTGIDLLGLLGVLTGLALMYTGLTRSKRSFLIGSLLVGVGLVGLFIRLETSDDAFTVFLPPIAAGLAVLTLTLQRA
jgi:hypothetical protein